jgi:hypothetical protein
MIAGIDASAQTANCGVMRFGVLQDDYSFSTHHHKELVAGLYTQGLSSLTRDHDLVLRCTIWFFAERVASVIALRCSTM